MVGNFLRGSRLIQAGVDGLSQRMGTGEGDRPGRHDFRAIPRISTIGDPVDEAELEHGAHVARDRGRGSSGVRGDLVGLARFCHVGEDCIPYWLEARRPGAFDDRLTRVGCFRVGRTAN